LLAFAAMPGARAADTADAPPEPTSAAIATAIEGANIGPSGAASATKAASAPRASPVAAPLARTIEPRAFGYVLGDVLTQRVLLTGAAGDVPQGALPSAGRIGVWLERRPSRIETGTDGHRWLVLSYQVTNSPPSLTAIELPALTLNLQAGAPLHVAAWPVTIGPLTPDSITGNGDLQAMRPDRPPPHLPLDRIERRFAGSLGALAVALLAWAAWWLLRNRREAARLPFARAWRDLSPGSTNMNAETDDPAAWRRLHRALDETAGRVVQHDTLAPLFARAPWLEPLRASLEQFYQQSAARFFGTGVPTASYPLRQLARELYLAERRRQR
jgi:mxaA protein